MNGINDNDATNPSVNNKKTQTFNLIIGVATLLIALLGATFAYFTATARSAEGEVTVKSAMVSITFDRGTAIKANNLIPSSEKVALSKYQKTTEAFVPGEGESYILDYEEYIEQGDHTDLSDYLDRRCIDSQGKEVCYVFWFSVVSDGEVGESTDILSYIRVDRNEFENLSYLVYEVEYRKDENDKIVNDKYGFGIVDSYRLVSEFEEDDTVSIREDIPFGRFGRIENVYNEDVLVDTLYPVACLFGETDDADSKSKDDVSRCETHTISNAEEHNYQIVIWLEETGYEQLEQGKTFSGTVSVEVKGDNGTTSGTGRVTGRE